LGFLPFEILGRITVDRTYKPTRKQLKAHRSKASYILFGGSVGGAKTTWLVNEAIAHCLKYPGARGFLARHQLTSFRKTTLITLLDWLPLEWISQHHKSENYIELKNGSRIYYGGLGDDIRAIEKLKSLELSFYGIDQVEETTENFFFMLNSRLRLKIPGVKYKAWLTANPTSNWVRARWIEAMIEGHEFVQALPGDNPHLPSSYIEDQRKFLPEDLAKAWLDGDWSIISDEKNVFSYTDILATMKASLKIPKRFKECLGCDPARYGKDETVIVRKKGSIIAFEDIYGKVDTMETAGRLIRAAGNKKMPIKVDSIGVGAGIADRLKELGYNLIEVIASARPFKNKLYKNKRAEDYFNLADMVEKGEISLPKDDKLKMQMVGIRYRIFSDGLLIIESKDEMRKRGLGSPDRLDAVVIACSGEGTIGKQIRRGVRLTAISMDDEELPSRGWQRFA